MKKLLLCLLFPLCLVADANYTYFVCGDFELMREINTRPFGESSVTRKLTVIFKHPDANLWVAPVPNDKVPKVSSYITPEELVSFVVLTNLPSEWQQTNWYSTIQPED